MLLGFQILGDFPEILDFFSNLILLWSENMLCMILILLNFFVFFFIKNFFSNVFIYFWDRERQSMNGGGAEREGDTESETGSRL